MIPWPIALLSLFYGVLATVSVGMVWRIVAGTSRQSLIWALLWLGLSAGVMCGLPLLKAWARTLAVFGSVVMMVLMVMIAALLIGAGHPVAALLTTFGAGMHMIIIRYLRRPLVRQLFENAECGMRSSE